MVCGSELYIETGCVREESDTDSNDYQVLAATSAETTTTSKLVQKERAI